VEFSSDENKISLQLKAPDMGTRNRPPEWPVKLLRFFIKRHYVEEIEGDMEELFHDNVERYSLRKAKRIYRVEAIKVLRPILLRNINHTSTIIQPAMLTNYFKIAWRNLIKKKAYSMINIFGLGLGIACCFLIFMFVQDELSFDNYHKNGNRIYRVIHGSKSSADSKSAHANPFWVWGNAPIGPALQNDFLKLIK
jgi:putative ABC transport system permease protein